MLAAAYINYSAFDCQLIGDLSTRAVLVGLLNLQNRFNKLKSISTDAGRCFNKDNLNPQIISEQSEDIKHLFDQVGFFTTPPNAQWQNYCERQIQSFKKLVQSMLKFLRILPGQSQ